MCDRYELKTTARALARHCRGLRLAPPALPVGGDMRPDQPVLMLTRGGEGHVASPVRWGLVGSFLGKVPPCPPRSLLSEGLVDKPFYGKLLQRNRCLLPATAYFEWQALAGGARQQMRFRDARGGLLLLAAIFDRHPVAGTTCAILTTSANPTVAPVHGRMPVIIESEEAAFWLADHAEFPAGDFVALLDNASRGALHGEALPEPEISPQLSLAFA